MSDSAQVIVDIDVTPDEAPKLAESVLAWLVGEGIIVAEPSDSALGGEGHRPGPNHQAATFGEAVPALWTNGVGVIVGRQVFDAGGNGIELLCASCHARFEPGDAWIDAVSAWAEGNDEATFACPRCGEQRRLVDWQGPCPWAFGSLGLKFWNWPPLPEDFVRAVSKKLGHRVVRVWARI